MEKVYMKRVSSKKTGDPERGWVPELIQESGQKQIFSGRICGVIQAVYKVHGRIFGLWESPTQSPENRSIQKTKDEQAVVALENDNLVTR